jgi:HAD superfamily hydrolase (TIGR01509 family)
MGLIRAIIFDFDGTILDTETVSYNVFHEICKEYDLDLPLERWADGVGTWGGFNLYEHLETGLGSPIDRVAVEQKFQQLQAERIQKLALRPGVRNTLEEARLMGLRIGLATSSYRDWVEPWLCKHDLFHFFDAIHTADDVQKVKPDPALYRLAVQSLDVEPTEAVAIEDSVNGLRAAKSAGLRSIVVPNPVTASMNFSEANLVVASLAEQPLKRLLARLE